MSYTLPDLEYDYSALEPHIDARTMEIHHTKHHQAYTDKLNAAMQGNPMAGEPIETVLARVQELPESIRQAVINNGGGYANHNLFWTLLSPSGGGAPTGSLASAIDAAFGSFDAFKEQFESAAATRFGSGWAWLASDSQGALSVFSTANQDSPIMQGLHPVVGLDVWEHAYYLHYQNRRPDYIKAFWNVVDWSRAQQYYDNIVKG